MGEKEKKRTERVREKEKTVRRKAMEAQGKHSCGAELALRNISRRRSAVAHGRV